MSEKSSAPYPKRFKIATLGCRTNQYESQAFADQLAALGYTRVSEDEKADICVVNTCTVTQGADRSSRAAIRQLVQENPQAKLAITGCFAEAKPDVIQSIAPEALIVRNRDKESLIAQVLPEISVPEFSIKHFDAHTRAFVKVQDGCNSFCTYCIIPYVRGRSRSRRIDEIVCEVEELIQNGYKEVVITGINVGDFDGAPHEGESPKSLADLVRTVDAIPGLKRLRISSIDPDEVDDDLMDAVLNGKTTCPSMHIVLQSGSNVILKRMNRKYTRQIFMQTIDRLRSHSLDFTFTTDIIVGFPGETEADFADTLAVITDVGFAKVHLFPYSDRPRTRSALMPGKIPSEVLRARKAQAFEVIEKAAFQLRNPYIGRTMSVLLESSQDSPGIIKGHTANFLEVSLPKGNLSPNQLVEARLIENSPQGLLGEYAAH
jgi:threonylcarbamoyladenosine tRNA methylthiotransferase MtaB